MSKTIKRTSHLIFVLVLSLSMILVFTNALAIEPEELTSTTVFDSSGKVVTVGIEPGTNTWSALTDGQNITIYTGLAPNENGMWYCVAGRVKFDYTGFVQFQNEYWYVMNGKVATDFTGEVPDGDKTRMVERGKYTGDKFALATTQDVSANSNKSDYESWILPLVGLAAIALIIILARRSSKAKKKSANSVKKVVPPSVPVSKEATEATTVTDDEEEELIEIIEIEEELPYRRKNLLTKNEKYFYQSLKPIAEKLGLIVLAKVRMGDLVEPLPTQDRSKWFSDWGRVKPRHVDFALADPDDMYVRLLIELDDSSHNNAKSQETDQFKNAVYYSAGYPLLRVKGTYGLEEAIREMLG